MKSILLASVLFAASAFHSSAQISPVRLDVLQKQKTDSKGKSNESKTQIRSLDISLQNISRQPYDKLVVKYWFFTRDVNNKGEPSVFKQGERTASLAPGKKEVIASEEVQSSFTEDHVESGGKGKGGKGGGKAKKVEGKGDKIVGYGVRVFDGDKVLTEFFSPQGLKEQVK
jgi:hypothetical protein